MIFKEKVKYTKEGRLEDILALIQVLSQHEKSHRSEKGLTNELPQKPNSSESWIELASEHQEFFRVLKNRDYPVSLVIRHISEETGKDRPPLSSDQTQTLLSTAIELHDRQNNRYNRWTVLIPIWVAVISGVFLLAKTLIK